MHAARTSSSPTRVAPRWPRWQRRPDAQPAVVPDAHPRVLRVRLTGAEDTVSLLLRPLETVDRGCLRGVHRRAVTAPGGQGVIACAAGCGTRFVRRRSTQIWCSESCRLRVRDRRRRVVEAAERQAHRARGDWDGVRQRSDAYGTAPRHEARCLHCGRVVLPTDGRLAWWRAVSTLRCEACRGWLQIGVQDAPGAGSGTADVLRAVSSKPWRVIPTGRVA